MSEQTPRFHTISDFCRTAGISRSFFYKLQQDGKAPPVTKVRARNFIAERDAAAWPGSITATEEAPEEAPMRGEAASADQRLSEIVREAIAHAERRKVAAAQ